MAQRAARSALEARIVAVALAPRLAIQAAANSLLQEILSAKTYQMATKSPREPTRTRLHSLHASSESTELQLVERVRHALSVNRVMRRQHRAAPPVHTQSLAGPAAPPFLMAASRAPMQQGTLRALATMSTTISLLASARATAQPTPSATLLLAPSQSASWVSTSMALPKLVQTVQPAKSVPTVSTQRA
jgi:hypothetical protein